MKLRSILFWFLLIYFGFLFFTGLMMNTAVLAEDLPPRPTTVPTSTAIPPPLSPTAAGFIQLQATTASHTANQWTRIQWQHPETEEWIFVEGWQGKFDETQQVTWYVAPENIGATADFRWLVYENEEQDTLLALSIPFSLPQYDRETVTVEVSWE